MTEQMAEQVTGHVTGNPHVDGVLVTLAGLDDLPVDQHVAVFEAAHVGLRQALSDPLPEQG